MSSTPIMTSTAPLVDEDQPRVTGTTFGTDRHALDVNMLSGFLQGIIFDYISATYPSSTQEVYTYKSGGSGGTTTATVTVNYTDATKKNLASVARS